MITERQYTLTKQPYRELYYKINLLDYNFQIVDDISGQVISDSWTISATSDIRRTGTLTISSNDLDAYKIQAGSKIFLDKYVQVYIGIKDNQTDEVIYNNMGIYLINNPNHTFDSTTNQITLQLVDLMAKLTGLRNGSLEGYAYQLLEGQSVRDIIIAILDKVGFHNYIINIDSDDYQTVQFDMSVDGTSTLYEVLATLNNNQYINYQMYFDVDGCFHFEKIPSGNNDMIMVDDDIWREVYLSHDISTDYENLKNHIIVLGKTHTASKYSNDCALDTSTNTFTMSSASVKRETNRIKIAFTTPTDMLPTHEGEQYYLNLNNYGRYPLKTASGNIDFILQPNTYYVVKLQNIARWSVNMSGVQNTIDYSLSNKIDYDGDDSDLIGCYISHTAKSLSEAIEEDVRIVAYDSQNLTLSTNATLNPDADWTNRLCYIYKNDTSKIYWEFMGEYQPRAEIQENNPDSPFYVNGSVGDIKIVLSGGDYDNISTSELAMERAKWELYTRCRLLDSLTLTCIPIYWLDVNYLISITLPTETEPKLFIIKEISISSGVNGVQTINLMSFYDYYDGHESFLLDSDNIYILDSNNDKIITEIIGD